MRRMFDEKQVKELGAEGAVAEIAKGNVENAKPLYYHPIIIDRPTRGVRISFWIINQRASAYDKTSFKAFLASLDDTSIRLNVTGAYKIDDGKVLIVSDVRTIAANSHCLTGLYADTGAYYITTESIEDIIDDASSALADSVNKIN